MKLQRLNRKQDLKPYLKTALYQAFKPDWLELQQAQLHLLVGDSEPLARCSLWWHNSPYYQGERVGLIGHYAALQDQAAQQLLEQACSVLKEQHCSIAIGPMDGSSWRNYRLVSEGSAPAFLLEPSNPATYPKHWLNAGFQVLAEYCSVRQTNLDPDERLAGWLDRLADQGINLRQLDMNKLAAELEAIFELSLVSFAKNFLYTPISKEEFMAQYQQVLAYLKPELVLLAEHRDKLIGYLFALPDHLQSQRGEQLDTFIIKTLATHPDYAGQGIASSLTALCLQHARKLGFSKAIHALMLVNNRSRAISKHYQQELLRRYSLYAKPL